VVLNFEVVQHFSDDGDRLLVGHEDDTLVVAWYALNQFSDGVELVAKTLLSCAVFGPSQVGDFDLVNDCDERATSLLNTCLVTDP
jgi:hypothetical protein